MEDIPEFLAAMADDAGDIIVGSRMDYTSPMPILRLLTNRVMSAIISRL